MEDELPCVYTRCPFLSARKVGYLALLDGSWMFEAVSSKMLRSCCSCEITCVAKWSAFSVALSVDTALMWATIF